MTDDTRKRGFRTTLSHVGRITKNEHGFVNPPLLRGSTVLVPTVAERKVMGARRGEQVLTYGTGGSSTHWALEDAMAAIEGGTRCYIVSTGLAAVTTPLLLKTVMAGRLKPKQLITHHFTLADIIKAYDTFGNAGREHALKVIVTNE